MPVEADGSTDEPQAVYTGCICEWGRYGRHEAGCPTQPIKIVKPTPYAGTRAWRKYNLARKSK